MANNAGVRAFQNAKRQKHLKKDAEVLLSAALAAYQEGRFSDAHSLCERVLEVLPNSFNALHLAGMCELETGNCASAEATLRKALKIEPGSSEALSNLGVVLFQMRRFDEARKSYERATFLKPNYPTALNNLGNTLHRMGLNDQAIAQYDCAINLKPDYADAYVNRGMALLVLGQEQQADLSFDRALSFHLGYLPAIVGKGMVSLSLRHLDAAFSYFDRVLKARPRFSEALAYRGLAYLQMRKLDNAKDDFRAALSIDATLEVAWTGNAEACLLSNNLAQGLSSCQRALEIDPNSESAIVSLANCHAGQGKVVLAIECYDRAILINPRSKNAITQKIFALDFLPDADFSTHQAARGYWWDAIGSKIPAIQLQDTNREPNRRLVLGYVSSDFRDHSAALAFRPVLRNHNHQEFEVICYSCSLQRDAATVEFQSMADKWVDASQMSDDELASQIQSDKIDILVDLSGYSAGNRLAVFAKRPAALQVTAWGHPTGTGLPKIDFLFSDSTTIPEIARNSFLEKIHDLPCAITLEPVIDAQPSALPMLRNGYVTFGVFNRIQKISDAALSVWCKLLKAIPQSKIIIKNGALDDPFLQEGLVARFVREGLPRGRIKCLGSTSREEHLLAFADVDISLDPFPQNGGVSTWESLCMGVPVVAKLGNSVSSRIAGAIVKSIGLEDWVVEDDLQYVTAATGFASMPDYLETLRARLPDIIANSQSGNPRHYVRHVESAYRKFWHGYCAEGAA